MSKNFTAFALLCGLVLQAQKLPDLIPYRKGNKWGYCDSTKKIIIPCRFDKADLFYGMDSVQVEFDNKRAWLRKDGTLGKTDTIISQPYGLSVTATGSYTWIYSWTPNPCKGPYPLYNPTGSAVFVSCKGDTLFGGKRFQSANYFSEGLAFVHKNDSVYGFIDLSGKFVKRFKPYEIDNVEPFNHGLCVFQQQGRYGLMDRNLRWVLPPVCEEVVIWNANCVLVKNGFYYFAGKDGRPLNEQLYDKAEDHGNERKQPVLVSRDDRWGYVNRLGQLIVPCKYFEASTFSEGRAAVKLNDKWGYLDVSGKTIIPHVYDEASHFSQGLAAVYKDGKWAFIKRSGTALTAFDYDEAGSFHSHWKIAWVRQNGYYVLIDGNGRLYGGPYETAPSFNDHGLAQVRAGGQLFYIDHRGQEYRE